MATLNDEQIYSIGELVRLEALPWVTSGLHNYKLAILNHNLKFRNTPQEIELEHRSGTQRQKYFIKGSEIKKIFFNR